MLTVRTIEKPVTVMQTERAGVTLELTDDDAQKLKALIGRTVGADLADLYRALDKEYPKHRYEVVVQSPNSTRPTLQIRAVSE